MLHHYMDDRGYNFTHNLRCIANLVAIDATDSRPIPRGLLMVTRRLRSVVNPKPGKPITDVTAGKRIVEGLSSFR